MPKWPLVLFVLALLWLGIAGFNYLLAEKEGGLTVYLSTKGCSGGATSEVEASDCSRAEWFYVNWWVLPSCAVAATALLAAGFAWAGRRRETDAEWLARTFEEP